MENSTLLALENLISSEVSRRFDDPAAQAELLLLQEFMLIQANLIEAVLTGAGA